MRTAHLGFLFAILLSSGPAAAGEVATDDYPWLADAAELPPMTTLQSQFDPPKGFTRVSAAEDSFASWLRDLPVRSDRSDVRAYNGERLSRPSAAVVAMDEACATKPLLSAMR